MEWTGKQVRSDKPGVIDESLTPIYLIDERGMERPDNHLASSSNRLYR